MTSIMDAGIEKTGYVAPESEEFILYTEGCMIDASGEIEPGEGD